MNGIDAVVPAVIADAMDLGWIGESANRAVAPDGAVLPTAFPEPIDDLHVFLGDRVALFVSRLRHQPHTGGGAVEITGDDVPPGTPLGQVVERRHAASEGVGRLVG